MSDTTVDTEQPPPTGHTPLKILIIQHGCSSSSLSTGRSTSTPTSHHTLSSVDSGSILAGPNSVLYGFNNSKNQTVLNISGIAEMSTPSNRSPNGNTARQPSAITTANQHSAPGAVACASINSCGPFPYNASHSRTYGRS